MLEEERGDLLGEAFGGPARGLAPRVAGVLEAGPGEAVEELVEPVGDGGEQLAGDLAGALGGAQQLVDVALDADAELGDLVADAAVLELGDAGRDDLAAARDEVAPLDELLEPRDDGLDPRLARRDLAAPLGPRERGGHLTRGQVREQRRREQPHDRQVGPPVLAGIQVGVQLEPRLRP